jgi:nucleoside-diphosphate-sugar epimerase
MRILFTGASSFSGFHFVTALARAGNDLICPVRGRLATYAGLRRERVERLQSIARIVNNTAFGDESFLKLISDSQPVDLLCHHAADVANYKSPDFDPARAVANNTKNLSAVLSALKGSGAKAVVLTGTLFEPDEGKGDQNLRAFSPYGLSKGLTWQMFRYYCEMAGLPLGKFVMPNPFGPLEEPRFTSYLMTSWKTGKSAQVKTPDYVRDNCHVSLLALAYVAFANRAAALSAGSISTSPSGYAETQRAFTARVAREVAIRTGWACSFDLLKQEDFTEPLARSNKEPILAAFPEWSESAAWDEFVQFYQRNP